MSTPVAWMAHPFSGNPDNLQRAKRWMRWLIRSIADVDFAADWILWIELLDDSNAAERARGLAFDEEMVHRCDQLWLVGGHVSPGMVREQQAAVAAGLPVVDLTSFGDEPPTDPQVIVRLQVMVAAMVDGVDGTERVV